MVDKKCLTITRKHGQGVWIGPVFVKVVFDANRGRQVKLSIHAHESVRITREELLEESHESRGVRTNA